MSLFINPESDAYTRSTTSVRCGQASVASGGSHPPTIPGVYCLPVQTVKIPSI